MFDKLQQLKKLKDLQNSLADEKIEAGKDGVKVVINGKMEVQEIQINPELDKERQEKVLQDCFNEAIKKIQVAAAQKMSQMGSF